MRICLRIIAGLLCLSNSVFASYPHFGGAVSLPLITKDPQHLYGYRASLWYQPNALVLRPNLRVYFDGSFGHWWVTNNLHNKSLNIYAIAPTLRYYFLQKYTFSSFINLSIGLSYLTRTRLDGQNLGMHFAFQDELGIGASFGSKEQLSVTLSALHYSNGSLCSQNGGITAPLMVTGTYAFG